MEQARNLGGAETQHDVRQWALSRIDIRSPVAAGAWPVARVELMHPARGRVTDIASAPGAFDAAFAAAGQILGIAPKLQRYDVQSSGPAADGALAIRVEIELEMDSHRYRGASHGVDLVRCSLDAWLAAASRLLDGSSARQAGKPRPFQVSGVDENGDLWIFASDDDGAVQAVAAEFTAEGYSELTATHAP